MMLEVPVREFLENRKLLLNQVSGRSSTQMLNIVDTLKSRADDNWHKAPQQSLEIGQLISNIGDLTHNHWIKSLGSMVCGDAYEKLGDYHNAWTYLDRAGAGFWLIGDSVGWARTWIGRLSICIDLQRIDETLNAAYQANDVLLNAHETLLLFRLNQAIGILFDKCGQHAKAEKWYERAGTLIDHLAPQYESEIGDYYVNSGLCHHFMGHFKLARERYVKARAIYEKFDKKRVIGITDLNIASIDKQQGNYRQALEKFHELEKSNVLNDHLLANMKRSMVTCYLNLNCPDQAYDVATDASEIYQRLAMPYEQGLTLLDLAFATAWSNSAQAKTAALRLLEQAEHLFNDCLKSQAIQISDLRHWQATASLYRSYVALRHGDFSLALAEATIARDHFQVAQNRHLYGSALLVYAQSALALGDITNILEMIYEIRDIATETSNPIFDFNSLLLEGKYQELMKKEQLALSTYQDAAAIIDKIESQLTLSLKPVFREDKSEARLSIIRLCLAEKNVVQAYQTLEQLKSQAALNALVRQNDLPLRFNKSAPKEKIAEFEQVRLQLKELEQRTSDNPEIPHLRKTYENKLLLLSRLVDRSEHTTLGRYKPITMLEIEQIQHQIQEDVLLEFYTAGQQIGVFVLTSGHIAYYPLDIRVEELEHAIDALRQHIAWQFALSKPSQQLLKLTQSILKQLFDMLIRPILNRIENYRRLIIVPFQNLHFLPFHLLYDGNSYLIETHEVLIEPAAMLLTIEPPKQAGGALALGWKGQADTYLPLAEKEAEMVVSQLGGKCVVNATRDSLRSAPVAVLHIASHGKYHYEPELSFISLSDGPLFSAELLKYDMQYELVTLSACETGQARPSGGDELIGIGRGFMYAGAGALVTSMWQVHDTYAYFFMERFYGYLKCGTSKVVALSKTYHDVISAYGDRHPALWGAFQLSGNPNPLSSSSIPQEE